MGTSFHVRLTCTFILVFLLGLGGGAHGAPVRVIKGTITDIDTHQPIAAATVQIAGTGMATLSNDQGQYRILIGVDSCEIKFSHIAYYSERVPLTTGDSIVILDIALRSATIELPGQVVSAHDYNAAQRIILEAIKRKKDILSRLHDYSFDAYTKMLIRDLKKPDSSNILIMTETQLSCFWEQPNKYKEIIKSRRQTANIPAEGNLVSVGEILNFNKNRIDLGDYQVVSPTATDALDSYNYYLLDTVEIDGRRVFQLEVEPKSQTVPLFEGTIHIADSTYDVVAVDVGLNKGFHLTMIQNPRYSQKFAQFNSEFWMPVEIRFSCLVALKVPIPGVPSRMSVAYVASLHNFSFEKGTPRGTFNEYALEVAEDADKKDSVKWNAQQMIPLTADEVAAYRRIDSTEKSSHNVLKAGVAVLLFSALRGFPNEDLVHYNRVEGTYVGFGTTFDKLLPRSTVRVKTGYAFSGKYWEHEYGFSHEWWHKYRLWAGVRYSDEIVKRPTVFSPWAGNGSYALLYKFDPYDYYHQRGVSFTVDARPVRNTTLSLAYDDFKQYGMAATTDYSVFGRNDSTADYPAIIDGQVRKVRENPSITNGHLRSVSTELTYDTRRLINSKGTDIKLDEPNFAAVTLGAEIAKPGLIATDFDYRRYFIKATVRHTLLGLGASSLAIYAGSSTGTLPPQKYFTIPYGMDFLFIQPGFATLDNSNYSGSRAASITYSHHFRTLLWGKSGIPLIKKLPYTLTVHGRVFWTDFKNHPYQYGDEKIRTAPQPYREVGFTIGNLTPFLAPFNLSAGFYWQLSKYHTHQFSWSVGF